MRDLVQRGDWSDQERKDILDYCEADVAALAKLLPPMLRAYRSAASALARTLHGGGGQNGMGGRAGRRCQRWRAGAAELGGHIKRGRVIADIDADYGVFDGTTFKLDRFERYLAGERHPLASPAKRPTRSERRLLPGSRQARAAHRGAVAEQFRSLSQMRLSALAVGEDGRNRCLLSAPIPTGRNQPTIPNSSSARACGCALDQAATRRRPRLHRLVPARKSALRPPCRGTRL